MANFKARTIERNDILSSASASGGADASVIVSLYEALAGCAYSGGLIVNNTVGATASKAFASTDVSTAADTIAITAHGFVSGQAVTLTTSGTLPAPTLVLTTYYIIVVNANSIKLATSQANATAGTAIDLTTQGAGSSNVVPASASYSVFLDASNDGTNFVPYFSFESMTASTSWNWTLFPEYRYFRVRKTVAGGVVGVRADLLILGESA